MKAKVVVGLGWGDEGKGLTVDYLCSNLDPSKAIVVRFNGGQQAAHTVVTDKGKHIFANYGSGTLRDIPTYITEHCCFYPPNMMNERETLTDNIPFLVIHPLAKLTTPFDVAYNRVRETALQHGSCGIGVGATMERDKTPYKLHAIDTLNLTVLNRKLNVIREYYDRIRYEYCIKPGMGKLYNETVEVEMKYFYTALQHGLFEVGGYHLLEKFQEVIFEGAQGILLDMDHGVFPNVTYAHTTSKNAMQVCDRLGINDREVIYVTRCYATRHGAGWFVDKLLDIKNPHETNEKNEWQGSFRIGELDYDLLRYAVKVDKIYSHLAKRSLMVTCLDQRPLFQFDYERLGIFSDVYLSHSPNSKDVRRAVEIIN